MNKKLFYLFLILGGLLWFIASLVLIAGSIRDLSYSKDYKVQICNVVAKNIQSTDIVYSVFITLQYKNITKNFEVFDNHNKTITDEYYKNNYPIDSSVACYASTNDILLEIEQQYISVLVSSILFIVSGAIITALMIMRCVEDHKRRGYQDLDDPYDKELHNTIRSGEVIPSPEENILNSFNEAQNALWKNKSRIDSNTFDELRKIQIDALNGNSEERLLFQREVYDIIKNLSPF